TRRVRERSAGLGRVVSERDADRRGDGDVGAADRRRRRVGGERSPAPARGGREQEREGAEPHTGMMTSEWWTAPPDAQLTSVIGTRIVIHMNLSRLLILGSPPRHRPPPGA